MSRFLTVLAAALAIGGAAAGVAALPGPDRAAAVAADRVDPANDTHWG